MFVRRSPLTNSPAERTPLELGQFRRLLAFVGAYRRQLAVGMVATLISAALGLVFPQYVGAFFDTFVAGGTGQLDRVVLILLGIFLVQAVFNFLRSYLLALAGEGVVADLRTALYRHLLTLPVRFFETRKTGEITSRLTSDVAVVQGAVSQALPQLVSQAVFLLGSVVLLFVTNLQLTLLMLAVVPVAVLAGAYFGRKLRAISTDFQDRVAEANASAEEAIVGVRVVQSFTAEPLELKRYSDQVQASYRVALRRAVFRAVFVAGIVLAMFSAISVVLWYGGRLVIAGSLSPGNLVTFLLYTLFVAGAVGTLTGLYSQFQEALGATRRIFELLDETSDLVEPTDPVTPHPKGEVRFEAVAFRYGDRGDAHVLKEVSLLARPGEVIALVGPSGAGKSTLVSLIPRFYDPSRGRILLDGAELRDWPLRELRAQIGIVPQETQLFSGTIRENIRYGRPEATDLEVEAAAQAANAHDFIISFPQGYNTLVGERGIKLSGGQRQRVAIARALLKNPRILILDEATSSLDSESEALVQEALERLMQGRTTFVIAHRLSTVRRADRILVLENGKIVQEGTHEALMAKGGLYRDLYELQFKADLATARWG
ncbi:MAG: ATP-binding cassette domain-containing protein [Truepera sp.]|nr:ATP-binding cassette domain-containing protein [Truepera sp.]